jgi:ankyrin repeat protein
MNGHCAVLRLLLRHGGDPNQANANGELPIFVVLRRCGTLPPKTVREAGGEGVLERERKRQRNVTMLRYLLTYGADTTPRTKTGESTTDVALQCACSDDVLALIRKHGAPAASASPPQK